MFLMHSHVFQCVSTKFGPWYPYIPGMVMRVERMGAPNFADAIFYLGGISTVL